MAVDEELSALLHSIIINDRVFGWVEEYAKLKFRRGFRTLLNLLLRSFTVVVGVSSFSFGFATYVTNGPVA